MSIRTSVATALCVLTFTLLQDAHGRASECPDFYLAAPPDEMTQYFPVKTVSLFALLADAERWFSEEIGVSGLLVSGHGQTFLVPLGSRHYLYSYDAIQIDNSDLSECTLEKLDGVPVRVMGTLVPSTENIAKVAPLLHLRTIPALAEPQSPLCCVREPPPNSTEFLKNTPR